MCILRFNPFTVYFSRIEMIVDFNMFCSLHGILVSEMYCVDVLLSRSTTRSMHAKPLLLKQNSQHNNSRESYVLLIALCYFVDLGGVLYMCTLD